MKFPEFDLVEIEAYRNIPVKTKVNNDFNAYLFFSPSGIESFISAGSVIPSSAQVFVIGKTTGKVARKNFSNNVSESTFQSELIFVKSAVHKISINNSKRINELSE